MGLLQYDFDDLVAARHEAASIVLQDGVARLPSRPLECSVTPTIMASLRPDGKGRCLARRQATTCAATFGSRAGG
jgi:hypothetical protein